MSKSDAMPPETDANRQFTRAEAKTLRAGSAHYSAYVGPPTDYDFMAASQFRLLTTLGLRDRHKLLDFGCGSLRAGRLFLPYLLAGNYFGVEPNAWLIEDAIANEVGNDLIRLKRPRFSHNSEFRVDEFDVKFDFILAQSIFSHCGCDVIQTALTNFREVLADGGLILATFVHVDSSRSQREFDGAGWVYPQVVCYTSETILSFIQNAGLVGKWIPWRHPRQEWYVISSNSLELPLRSKFVHLSGAVLRRPRPDRRPNSKSDADFEAG